MERDSLMLVISKETKEDPFEFGFPMFTDRVGSRPFVYLYENGSMREAYDFDNEPHTQWYGCEGIRVVLPNEMA